jgi:uncharacterized membrane protein affecting hemolysin expression
MSTTNSVECLDNKLHGTDRVTNRLDFLRTVLILSFLYGIKLTLIPDGKKSRNSMTQNF